MHFNSFAVVISSENLCLPYEKKIKQKNLRSSITIAFNSFLIQRQNVAQFSKIKTNTFNSHNISSQAHAARKEFSKKLAFTHTWNLIFAKFKQNKNTLQMYIRRNTRLGNNQKQMCARL